MTDTSQILLQVLDAEDELEHLLGDLWRSFREELANLLLRLDIEGETVSLRRDSDAFLARLVASPAGARVQALVREIRAPAAQAGRRGGEAFSSDIKGRRSLDSGDAKKEPLIIPVYYATDRKESPEADVEARYTGERGELSFGVARVSIPASHRLGDIEAPRWWRLEMRPDPRKHVVLLGIDTMPSAEYIVALRKAVVTADLRDVLLYVHGYNVTFADAVRRTAQIAHDLRFPGRTLLYSWPSKGGKLGYPADEATIEWSTPHFESFLRTVLSEIGAATVHVLAHSMGNRVLARAIERLNPAALPPGLATLRQIIFAAPDIDRDVFLQIAAAFAGRAQRFTLYGSNKDVALRLSKTLHQGPRAGDGGDSLVIAPGFDSIDATDVDTSLFGLGHSYYADKRSILDDIFTLLKNGTPPGQRFDLIEELSSGGAYWRYRS